MYLMRINLKCPLKVCSYVVSFKSIKRSRQLSLCTGSTAKEVLSRIRKPSFIKSTLTRSPLFSPQNLTRILKRNARSIIRVQPAL